MAVLIPSDNIEPDDFINELYCPFCNGPEARQRPSSSISESSGGVRRAAPA